jgi:PAS domain S-box-containing protein
MTLNPSLEKNEAVSIGQTVRILCADENKDFVKWLSGLLQDDNNISTYEATSEAEVIETIENKSINITLIGKELLDTACSEIVEQRDEIRQKHSFIVLVDEEKQLSESITIGATAYLPRSKDPRHFKSFAEAIRSSSLVSKSPADLQAIYAELPIPVSFLAADTGEILCGNQALFELLDYPEGELLGSSIDDLRAEAADPYEEGETLNFPLATDSESSQPPEVAIRTGGGNTIWVQMWMCPINAGATTILLACYTDITDRKRRERRLEQTERRFQQIAEGVNEAIYIATTDMSEVIYINSSYEEIWGRSVNELYEAPMSFIEGIHPDDRDEYLQKMEEMRHGMQNDTPQDTYEFQYRVVQPDGEIRWVDATGYPVWNVDNEVHRIAGVIRDVTERKQREQTLDTFRETTRQLVETESEIRASDIAVEAGTDVLDFQFASVHLHDKSSGVLEPVAATGLEEYPKTDLPEFGPDCDLSWKAFAEGKLVRSGPETNRNVYSDRSELVVPLGPHGVMVLVSGYEAIDTEASKLARIFGATLEAALTHINRQSELSEREEELKQKDERLTYLDQLNNVIRNIEKAIVNHSTKSKIKTVICNRLTGMDSYEFAWIGETTNSGKSVVPVAKSDDGNLPDEIPLDIEQPHPSSLALKQGEVVHIDNIAAVAEKIDWRERMLTKGCQSCCAVPLVYNDVIHGVLTITSAHPEAFPESEQAVLKDLGKTVGYALTAIERKRALESNLTIELEFGIRDGTPVNLLSERYNCSVQLERVLRRANGSVSRYFSLDTTVTDGVAQDIHQAVPGTECRVLVKNEHSCLIELRSDAWFGSVFAEHGAVVRMARAEDGLGRLRVELPQAADIRNLVEKFQKEHPNTSLLSKREKDQAQQTITGIQSTLKEQLTDRQLEVLEKSYLSGYFSCPRESNGGEVADELDITQPTFSKLLRNAERRVFSQLFTDGDVDTSASINSRKRD